MEIGRWKRGVQSVAPVVFGSVNRGCPKGMYLWRPRVDGYWMRGVQKECEFVAPCRLVAPVVFGSVNRGVCKGVYLGAPWRWVLERGVSRRVCICGPVVFGSMNRGVQRSVFWGPRGDGYWNEGCAKRVCICGPV